MNYVKKQWSHIARWYKCSRFEKHRTYRDACVAAGRERRESGRARRVVSCPICSGYHVRSAMR